MKKRLDISIQLETTMKQQKGGKQEENIVGSYQKKRKNPETS